MRRTFGRGAAALALALCVSLGFGRPVAWTLAVIGDIEAVPSTFSTETLDPPTSLTATAALFLTVNLAWVATVDTRATGYQVFRGTVNGGPYTQIGTVTSRTTTTYQDLPLVPGTYYYVLETYFGSWTSANSNQASATAL